MKKFGFYIITITFFLLSNPVFSQSNSSEEDFNIWGSGEVFALNPVTDGVLLGSGLLLSGGDLILDNILEVNRQEYDGKVYSKDDVNSFDRAFMHSYSKNLDRGADILLLASMATPAVLAATEKEEWLTCGIMYAESLLIVNGIKELTKLSVNRTRPYMYYDSSSYPEDDVEDGDWANSFPSGHTSIAFTGASFASYTFCKYFPDSSLKIPVIAGSYAMACGVAVLRIYSGNHFLTDVISGAALGSAVGILVPWLHTFNLKHDDLNVALLPNGLSFRLKF